MLLKVVGQCTPECGVGVQGEVETASREFIHRFILPSGTEQLVEGTPTEVEGMHLATFSPDEKEWRIECPLCRNSILVVKLGT